MSYLTKPLLSPPQYYLLLWQTSASRSGLQDIASPGDTYRRMNGGCPAPRSPAGDYNGLRETETERQEEVAGPLRPANHL
jgi:hypothetical protein